MGIETLFWLARIESSGEAGIVIVGRSHEEHYNRGASGLVALLVEEIEHALSF